MTRTAVPFSAPDLSALARSLEKALAEHQATHGRLPGHVEMMNLLARGVGQRNLQALQVAARATLAVHGRAATDSRERVATVAHEPVERWFDAPVADLPAAAPVAGPAAPELSAHARKALAHFDGAGRLERWPHKLSVQRLAMWVLWTRFDASRLYTEAQLNQVLKAWHLYGDHATLRRELIDHQLFVRKSDCSEYRKARLTPDDEVRALLQALRSPARRKTAQRSTRPPRVLPKAVAAPGMSPASLAASPLASLQASLQAPAPAPAPTSVSAP